MPALSPFRLGAAPATLTAQESGTPRVPRVTGIAYSGGPMRPELPKLDAPIVVDLAETIVDDDLALYLGHDETQLVGQAQATVARGALTINGVLSGNIADPADPAAKIVTHAKNGFAWKASIAGYLGELTLLETGETAVVNGRTVSGPMYIARGGRITSVAILPTPADAAAVLKIAAAAARKGRASMGFHEWLKANDFDPTNLTEPQRDTLLASFEATTLAAGEGGDKLAAGALRANQKRETELEAAIAEAPGGTTTDALAACARSEKWSAGRFRLNHLRETAVHVNNRITAAPGGAGDAGDVLRAGALIRLGHAELAAKAYGERAAHRAAEQGHRHILDLAAACCRAKGITPPRAPDELLRASGGASSLDLPNILGDSMHKIAQAAFVAAPSTWRSFARVVRVDDFKSAKILRLNGLEGFADLAPGGLLRHGTAGESAYSVSAGTQGRMFQISRADIINDNLQSLNDMPQVLARMAVNAVSKAVWTPIIANTGTHFAAGNLNNLSGNDSVLGIQSIGAAVALMRRQVGADNEPTSIMPRTLAVPPELENTGRAALNSTQVARVATGDVLPQGNPLPELRLEVEPRISNSGYTGYDAKFWFLFGAPADAPVLVAFLNGKEAPTIENVPPPADFLGLVYRAYHDFGAALGDPRAAVRGEGD